MVVMWLWSMTVASAFESTDHVAQLDAAARGWWLAKHRPHEVQCLAKLRIDPRGRPSRVDLNPECPKPFYKPIRKSLQRWRFEPYEHEGERVEVATVISVVFHEPGSGPPTQ